MSVTAAPLIGLLALHVLEVRQPLEVSAPRRGVQHRHACTIPCARVLGMEQKLKSQGLTVIEPDHESFRTVIRQAGLFARWRETYGAEPFDMLEKAVGTLT